MSIFNGLIRSKIFSHLTSSILRAEQVAKDQKKSRAEFDRRLDSLVKATLDGEDEWFLKLVREDPFCALNVINKCKEQKE